LRDSERGDRKQWVRERTRVRACQREEQTDSAREGTERIIE